MISTGSILVGALLVLAQFVAAAPWVALAFLTRQDLRDLRKRPFAPWLLQRVGVALGVCLVLPFLVLTTVQDRGALELSGQFYASILQLQLTVDAFIVGFIVILALWPKGGAVALAAFREGVRQWMFWLLLGLAAGLMFVSIFVPYFTFGEDYLMVKQLGYDTIMLAAILFGALAASLSISEEIEGRTAVTVMSKPISRRQFLLGKYVGIILAALFLFGVLSVYFEGVLLGKHYWEKLGSLGEESARESARIGVVVAPSWITSTLRGWALPGPATDFLRGAGQWLAHALDTLPGLVLSFSQVMVLVAIAVSLATRVPMVVNLPTVLVVYVFAHLTPVLVGLARNNQSNSPGARLLSFALRVFDTVLPDLGGFRMDSALLSDAPPQTGLFVSYLASVSLYGIVYTGIVLLVGLILFEDRDLA